MVDEGPIRVVPEVAAALMGTVSWGTNEDPRQPKEISIEATVRGGLKDGPHDVVRWRGELTLLRDYGTPDGLRQHHDPLRMLEYEFERVYEPVSRPEIGT